MSFPARTTSRRFTTGLQRWRTPANWNNPQFITVTGVDELIDDDDQSTDITVSVDAIQSDDDFDALDSKWDPPTATGFEPAATAA